MADKQLQRASIMENKPIKILTTRPLADDVMQEAKSRNIVIDTVSFIETENTIDQQTGMQIRQYAAKEVAAVFSSMNAAEAVIDCLKAFNAEPEWTIYTLGGITSVIIENYFTDSEIFGEAINATQLAQRIIDNEETEVIFFCGNQRRDELPNMLQQQAINVTEVLVYETIETPVEINEQYQGILFFSPSAVKSFFSKNNLSESTDLFAIGTTTAATCKQFANNKVFIASKPNKELLAQQAMNHLQIRNI